ncbi:PREDICTED: sugar phosphate exchanger 2 [Galeopterus variegatus]|uniref:Glucose-6-phosphate exchanger SLC37A2 n=1 Tax=Galeopterus variegatus TaxID=482537 RepID=A0ABM0R4L8_GALVR|nr:PREDICTED: sugar phosphate exchanger 2 [Galeopterus variegatus]
MRSRLAPGVWFLRAFSRDSWFRGSVLLMTFLIYTCYHMSRKPISVVKNRLHQNCSEIIIPINDTHSLNDTTWCSWSPFDKDNYSELLGGVDDAFLVAYAIGMFIRRGLIMGVWNSHTSVGNILGSLIAGVWVNGHWGLSFIVPGAITAAMGIITFLFLIEYPEDVDCSPPQHNNGPDDDQDNSEDTGIGPYSNRENSLETTPRCSKEPCAEPTAISFLGALKIPGVIEFSLCLLFAKLVSYTFLYWLPLYIANVAHFTSKEAGDLSTLFDVGGIIGGITAGLISDYTNGRATTCCIMLILAAPMMFLYDYFGQNGIISSTVMLIVCGALVNGPYALITTAVSADLGTHKSLKGNAKALSTVSAIIDGTGSVGAALGPLLAGLISPTGWNNVFYMLITADILACLLLCRLVYKEILAWKVSLNRDTGSNLALTHP